MKHTEDDGDLSIFASANQILIACSKGHCWVLDAQQFALDSSESINARPDETVTIASGQHVETGNTVTLNAIEQKFGHSSTVFLRSGVPKIGDF